MKYNGIRRIKTTQERRSNQEGWCRGRRKPKVLPNHWDDVPRTVENGWKANRKTQYRVLNDTKLKKDPTNYGKHMSRRGTQKSNRCCSIRDSNWWANIMPIHRGKHIS